MSSKVESSTGGRVLVTLFVALAMAAWLAVPTVGASANEHRPGEPQGEARGHDSAPRGEARGHDGQPQGEARGHDGQPQGEARGHDSTPRGEARAHDGENGDPNRGTVKIRDAGYDGSPRHEPHVWCDFSVVFLGFDADASRDFRIHVHPPTAEDGPGETLAHEGSVELDEARGSELSAEYGPIHLSELDGLTAENRHDQQGWHLKLTVDGPKHKVFWIDCDEEPDDIAALGEAEEAALGQVDEEQDLAARLGGWFPAEDRAGAPAEVTEVLGISETRELAAVGVSGLLDDGEAQGAAAGAEQLPVTGAHLLVLLTLGAGLAAAGAMILRRGRETA